jgi:hypothetical protein
MSRPSTHWQAMVQLSNMLSAIMRIKPRKAQSSGKCRSSSLQDVQSSHMLPIISVTICEPGTVHINILAHCCMPACRHGRVAGATSRQQLNCSQRHAISTPAQQ